jgi:hypothetical protein
MAVALALASPPTPAVVLDVTPQSVGGGLFVARSVALERRDRVPANADCACDHPQLSCEVERSAQLQVRLSMPDDADVPTDPGYVGQCTAADTVVDVEVRLVAAVPRPWWQGTTLVVPTVGTASRYLMSRVPLPAGLQGDQLRGSLESQLGRRGPRETGCYLPDDDDEVAVVHLVPGEVGVFDCLEGPDGDYDLKVVELQGPAL